ncbi:NADH dehydrogenase [ubiquinone] 1 beta subcomplex subunit 2 [Prunus dulcis]|uniref:NADH dehydrogenase [ubiquinone] 1 beta subcomplex subunit 2 n=1 Tax=Prunus dulcis TaxID=3755 RepID=A0A4Y1QSD2_PRUDU|nr:NADH dehydrogenase [ubiquinone] 1 beta subcomplex subunit 2 [Prunus dulcis]
MGGGHGEGTTYKGFTVHQPKRWHTLTGKGMCAMMWVGDIPGRGMVIIPMVIIRWPAFLFEESGQGPVEEARVGIIKGFSGGILMKMSLARPRTLEGGGGWLVGGGKYIEKRNSGVDQTPKHAV